MPSRVRAVIAGTALPVALKTSSCLHGDLHGSKASDQDAETRSPRLIEADCDSGGAERSGHEDAGGSALMSLPTAGSHIEAACLVPGREAWREYGLSLIHI